MRKKILIILILSVVILSACSLPDSGNTNGNGTALNSSANPQAWIDAPLNESYLPMAPYEIVFHVTASQAIIQGEISVDDTVLALLEMPESTENLTTWKYTWSPEIPGKHIIRVRGQNADGTWSKQDSAVVYIEGETPTPTAEITATPTITATPYAGFSNFTASPSSVHYGNCTPNQVTISANVVDTSGITTVVLFYRMRDETGQSTDWLNTAMNPGSGNQYSKTINLTSFDSPYSSGTLDIQLVIQNNNGEYVRSEVYSQIGISACLQPLFELDGPDIQIIPIIPTATPIIIK